MILINNNGETFQITDEDFKEVKEVLEENTEIIIYNESKNRFEYKDDKALPLYTTSEVNEEFGEDEDENEDEEGEDNDPNN